MGGNPQGRCQRFRLLLTRPYSLTVWSITLATLLPMAAPALTTRPEAPQLPPGSAPVPVRPVAPAGAPYALTPERRALLDTIRYAEGTWTDGADAGYRMLYGGRLITQLDRHPEITVRRRYTSAAAGAYQFLPGTWHGVARQLGLTSFGPAHQDQAALHLIHRRGALDLFDRTGLTPTVLARLAPEWASLPTLAGASHYGQPVKDRNQLVAFYRSALDRHQRGI